MNEVQRYEFDRQGFLVIESMLSAEQVARLAQAVDSLEEHAVARIDAPPRKRSSRGSEYHHDPDLGYHVEGSREEGATVIIEDFWNADPVFDVLIGHQPTMDHVSSVIQGRATINNSEIRIRYRGNQSTNHGGTRSAKYRYHVNRNGIDCMMVRMVYFLHDVSREQGAFCVIAGTHKGNFDCPYDTNDPDVEPGVVGLEVKAGDAIFFTEALRHGGLTNRSLEHAGTQDPARGVRPAFHDVAEHRDHGRAAVPHRYHARPSDGSATRPVPPLPRSVSGWPQGHLGQRASHALKRSFISSPWSLHHCQSWCSARRRLPGVVGMCGAISIPVSRCSVTSAVPERRTGL